jgi:hypothetical protein
MRFHVPSFLLGCVVGAVAVVALPKLRPVAVEAASAGYKLFDGLMARVAMAREGIEDLFVEARARARTARPGPERPVATA